LQGVVIGGGDVIGGACSGDCDGLEDVLVGEQGHVVTDEGVEVDEDVEDEREDHLRPQPATLVGGLL
jgi:hypothetical protein